MTTLQWIALVGAAAGAAAGAAGSIFIAFSLNSIIRDLTKATKDIAITVGDIANNSPDIRAFTGFDYFYERAVWRSKFWFRVGVLLLVAGFVLQAVGVWMAWSRG